MAHHEYSRIFLDQRSTDLRWVRCCCRYTRTRWACCIHSWLTHENIGAQGITNYSTTIARRLNIENLLPHLNTVPDGNRFSSPYSDLQLCYKAIKFFTRERARVSKVKRRSPLQDVLDGHLQTLHWAYVFSNEYIYLIVEAKPRFSYNDPLILFNLHRQVNRYNWITGNLPETEKT